MLTLKPIHQNTDLKILYNFQSLAVGIALIGQYNESICHLSLHKKNDTKHLSEIKKQWPHSTLHASTEVLDISSFDKLTVCGSDFKLKVWQALLKIPPAQTASYSDVAEMIDQPTAVRAVATAIGKNNIAILIPCHRVVPRIGGIGSYRWGSDIKQTLINLEKSKALQSSNSSLLIGEN